MNQLSFLTPNLKTSWRLYADGASRNNPGPSGAGMYIEKNGQPFIKKGYYLGTLTNNQAEYQAVLLGFFLIDEHWNHGDSLEIYADSQLMIRQLLGVYKVVNPQLRALWTCARAYLAGKEYSLHHIMREYNTIADKLANSAVDKKIALPPEYQIFAKRYAS